MVLIFTAVVVPIISRHRHNIVISLYKSILPNFRVFFRIFDQAIEWVLQAEVGHEVSFDHAKVLVLAKGHVVDLVGSIKIQAICSKLYQMVSIGICRNMKISWYPGYLDLTKEFATGLTSLLLFNDLSDFNITLHLFFNWVFSILIGYPMLIKPELLQLAPHILLVLAHDIHHA